MPFQKVFKALSDPTRRDILDILKSGRMSAGEITSHFELTQATISHHLSILKNAGLIAEYKDWKFVYYELNSSVLEEIMGWLIKLNVKGDESNDEINNKN